MWPPSRKASLEFRRTQGVWIQEAAIMRAEYLWAVSWAGGGGGGWGTAVRGERDAGDDPSCALFLCCVTAPTAAAAALAAYQWSACKKA
eukprot:scaffold177242_cov22-Tisochrysis_lutea.AAC.2